MKRQTAVLMAVGVGTGMVCIRDRATNRRRQMRQALVFYLTWVGMNLAAGLGPDAALAQAAKLPPAWTYRRIGGRIASSAREGESPWTGLSDLASELGINELAAWPDLSNLATELLEVNKLAAPAADLTGPRHCPAHEIYCYTTSQPFKEKIMKRQIAVLSGVTMALLMLALTLPERLTGIARDERGDGGGKGVIILIATVLGIAAVVAVGVLITGQINSRAPGLGK